MSQNLSEVVENAFGVTSLKSVRFLMILIANWCNHTSAILFQHLTIDLYQEILKIHYRFMKKLLRNASSVLSKCQKIDIAFPINSSDYMVKSPSASA